MCVCTVSIYPDTHTDSDPSAEEESLCSTLGLGDYVPYTTVYMSALWAGGASGKEPSASAGNMRDMGLIPGSGRCPGEGHGKHSSILAWRIPWTEE